MTAMSVTTDTSVTIGTRATTVIKNHNCHDCHKGHTAGKVTIATILMTATGSQQPRAPNRPLEPHSHMGYNSIKKLLATQDFQRSAHLFLEAHRVAHLHVERWRTYILEEIS